VVAVRNRTEALVLPCCHDGWNIAARRKERKRKEEKNLGCIDTRERSRRKGRVKDKKKTEKKRNHVSRCLMKRLVVITRMM